MTMARRIALTVLLLVVAASSQSSARTWNVYEDGSGDAPTIQAAIMMASDGDEILVHPGVYENDRLHFMGKAIWVHSVAGLGETEIKLTDGLWGSMVRFVDGETRDAKLEGFTLRGQGWTETDFGGGILVTNSSPTIRDCVITQMWAWIGGGVFCEGSGSNPLFERCAIEWNEAINGAGLFAYDGAFPEIRQCRFMRNEAQLFTGGIHAVEAGFLLQECLLIGNRTWILSGATAGAIYCVGAEGFVVEGCTIIRNRSESGAAGVEVDPPGHGSISNTIVADNGGPGISGGGITTVSCTDAYDNDGFDMAGYLDGGGNFSLSPKFCDPQGPFPLEWPLRSDSPCLPGNHPDGVDCGLIGAFGEGCSPPNPVEPTTWGRIKARFH
jgi:hypothetical protein